MSDTEPIKSIRTPVRLEYDYTAGFASSRFLRGLAKGKIIGARVGDDGPVYVPPRGADPKLGKPTDQQVEVADKGTVTTFCIVRVPSENLTFTPPYACISVLLDGANIPMMHVLQECDLEDVRMGMRVQAVWVDADQLETSVASIRYFKPIDEPDTPFDAYKEHL